MKNIFLLVLVFNLLMSGIVYAEANAEGEALKADAPAAEETAEPAQDSNTADEQALKEDEKKPEKKSMKKKKGDDDPMAPFAFSPRLGYSWFGPTRGDFKIGDLSARNCLLITLGLNMGGSGAGFNLVPFYSYESGDSEFHSAGLNMEFIYRWLIAKKWYPHFGVGSRIGFLWASDLDAGMELFLRVPVGFSYYFMEDLGMIFDFGFGYGFTGIMPSSVSTYYEFDDLRFGHGFMVDWTLGLTFP